MKISDVGDICLFVCKINGCHGAKCVTCPLDHGNIDVHKKLKGELEVVKECEHDWVYRINGYHDKCGVSSIQVIRCCSKLSTCGVSEYRMINKRDLIALFEDN